jgi:hypothetical protein
MKKSLMVFVFLLAPAICFPGTVVRLDRHHYEEGFNEALECLALVNLEMSLKNTPKTFGEMNNICRERNGLKKKESITAKTLPKEVEQKKPEKYYQEKWCSEHNGQSEVRLKDGTRVDCIATLPVDEMDGEYSIAYAIEHDFARKWAEAIGQSLHYSVMTNSFAGIVLILEKESDYKYLYRLKNVIDRCDLPIRIWFIEAWNFDEALIPAATHDGETYIRWDEIYSIDITGEADKSEK